MSPQWRIHYRRGSKQKVSVEIIIRELRFFVETECMRTLGAYFRENLFSLEKIALKCTTYRKMHFIHVRFSVCTFVEDSCQRRAAGRASSQCIHANKAYTDTPLSWERNGTRQTPPSIPARTTRLDLAQQRCQRAQHYSDSAAAASRCHRAHDRKNGVVHKTGSTWHIIMPPADRVTAMHSWQHPQKI